MSSINGMPQTTDTTTGAHGTVTLGKASAHHILGLRDFSVTQQFRALKGHIQINFLVSKDQLQ